MPHRLIAIIGQATPDEALEQLAREAGRLLAAAGVSLITGGLGGVMAAASEGFKQCPTRAGVVIGILPSSCPSDANPHVDIALATGIGEARNAIIASAADAFIAIGRGYGTLSEIGLAMKLGKKVVALRSWPIDDRVPCVESAAQAVAAVLKK